MEYSKTEIGVKVYSKLNSVQNLLIIFNIYHSWSPKKVIFEGKHLYWQKICQELKVDDNKTGLINLMADTMINFVTNNRKSWYYIIILSDHEIDLKHL